MDLTCVRIKEHFGIVTNNTKTSQFDFLITPIKNRAGISIGDYVILDHPMIGENNPVLAIVTEIQSNEDIMGTSHVDRIGKLMATAKPVGYVNLNHEAKPIQKLLAPPTPGSRVHLPCYEFLDDILKRDISGEPFKQPLCIGKMDSYATSQTENLKPLNFYINAIDLTDHHVLIAAADGAGKTQLAKTLVKELLNKTLKPIIILDAFGEYTTIENTKIITASANDKSNQEIEEFLIKETKANTPLIINAKNLETEQRRNIFLQYLSALWIARTKEKIEHIIVVIEDSENLVGDILDRIAFEGTKNGITMYLISRHPSALGSKVLSQMAIQMAGRTFDPTDIEKLKNYTLEKTEKLPQLYPNRWIINGITLKGPTEVTSGNIS